MILEKFQSNKNWVDVILISSTKNFNPINFSKCCMFPSEREVDLIQVRLVQEKGHSRIGSRIKLKTTTFFNQGWWLLWWKDDMWCPTTSSMGQASNHKGPFVSGKWIFRNYMSLFLSVIKIAEIKKKNECLILAIQWSLL